SFLACVVMMDISQPWAFFSLPTRAWELGAGGLVAFLLRSGARWLRSPLAGLLAWAGLAGLAAVVLTSGAGTAVPGAGWRRPRRSRGLAWAGLAGLAAVVLPFDAASAFPGAVAALPVLATAAMIIGGAAPGALHATRLLALAPMQFLGAISYSLYLVH